MVVPREPEKIALGFPSARSVADVMAAYVAGDWRYNDIRADRVWGRFAAGEELAQAAAAIGISYETARNQLKAVFSKTGTSRQAALALLLARFARR